jgi:hypothetical protein
MANQSKIRRLIAKLDEVTFMPISLATIAAAPVEDKRFWDIRVSAKTKMASAPPPRLLCFDLSLPAYAKIRRQSAL